MSQIQLAGLLSLLCVVALGLAGWRPYVDEFRGSARRGIAVLLFIAILTVAVFAPVTSFGDAEDIDPATLWFPSLLTGHLLVLAFLGLWWRLRRDVTLAAFFHLSTGRVWARVQQGVIAGAGGWIMTLAVTGAAAAAMAATGNGAEPTGAPPIMVWLAELPVLDKLVIIAVAMTVEEAFFRGFLQTRFGLLLSSVMFAFSHFSYGLPVMIVGVFTISLVIGRTFERTGDLLPCIIAHGVFDGVQLLIVLPWAVRVWGTGTGA